MRRCFSDLREEIYSSHEVFQPSPSWAPTDACICSDTSRIRSHLQAQTHLFPMPTNKGHGRIFVVCLPKPSIARINILQSSFSLMPHINCFFIPFSKQLSSANKMPGTMRGAKIQREKNAKHILEELTVCMSHTCMCTHVSCCSVAKC